jgi:Protein of unknown function (DUF2851)
MTERLLQFIWQFQYFNSRTLETTSDETLQVVFPGTPNSNQGPDFLNARIVLDGTNWAGHIELHVKASSWTRHRHSADGNYDSVILHVVWEADAPGPPIPVLELKPRVAKILLEKFARLMAQPSFIPCERTIGEIGALAWTAWKDRLVMERLERKMDPIESALDQCNYRWEEAFWWLLARNFGMKVNAEAFEEMARSLPLVILARHKSRVPQLEALLMGQAHLLDDSFDDEYPRMLAREYRFLKKKYQLANCPTPLYFLRMRPANFPTIRIAQLAMVISQSTHLFSQIREAVSANEIIEQLRVTPNDYWLYHYRFDQHSALRKKTIGSDMIHGLVINTVVPMLFSYGKFHQYASLMEKAISWLQALPPEQHSITQGFRELGIFSSCAFDTQALIELKSQYCDKKKCLDCAVGNAILKSLTAK